MKYHLSSAKDIGQLVKAVRKQSNIRQDDLAGLVGVSRQFATDLEKGKPTLQLEKVLLVLAELGIRLEVEVPEPVLEKLADIQAAQATKAENAIKQTDTTETAKAQP
ncbi:helix-turn-helix transcriptional regulator [Lampropedia puyangensis]|uniref:Helix-turn-helix transcriptional regulator n=1 Tax=Lampropedia puyangensis TaxID=1330072 RepID=A0A4S8EZ94_9BURK|nr:helix-turn-helix domain-containing protein [Lampropedia puyangensis]THT99630.1 helix-turn-helix transcriptional regulator [Lampropedia puyangensis]